MEAHFDLTEEDVLALQRHFTDHPPRGSGWVGRAPLLAPLFFLGLGTLLLLVFLTLPAEDGSFPVYIPIIMIVGAVLLYLLRHRRAARSVRAIYRRPASSKIFGRHQYSLTPEGMAAATPTTVSLTSWPAFMEIAVGPQHAFFFISPRQAFVLPRRAFEDEEQFRRFVEMARGYMGRFNVE